MADSDESLTISVSSLKEVKTGKETFTVYVTDCRYGDASWSVLRRYSQFLDLKVHLERAAVVVAAPFPKKGFGFETASGLAKRCVELDAFMRELSDRWSTAASKDVRAQLGAFVDLQAHAGPGIDQAKENRVAMTPPKVTPPKVTPPKASEEAEGGAAAAYPAPAPAPAAPVWDSSFMEHDPLASLLQPPERPKPERPKPERPPHERPEPPPAQAAAAAPGAAAFLGAKPAFLFGSGDDGAKRYRPTGEGLRDAIKAGDVDGVKRVLEASPDTCHYRDRLTQSMLHLAAIFNHSKIAEMLLAAGADPTVTNRCLSAPVSSVHLPERESPTAPRSLPALPMLPASAKKRLRLIWPNQR